MGENYKSWSIADLKAAHDFLLLHLEELKEEALKKNVDPWLAIPAFPEVKKQENMLYHILLNRITSVKN